MSTPRWPCELLGSMVVEKGRDADVTMSDFDFTKYHTIK